jgi:hypothetical protein
MLFQEVIKEKITKFFTESNQVFNQRIEIIRLILQHVY